MASSSPTPQRCDLPQRLCEDRERARRATLAARRHRYRIARDPGLADDPSCHLPPSLAPWDGASGLRRALAATVKLLPPKDIFLSELPPEARFRGAKMFRHATHAGSWKMRQIYVRLTNLDFWPSSEAAYARLLGTIPPPRARETWSEDWQFANQRLNGVDPMAIRRCHDNPGDALVTAADGVLRLREQTTFAEAQEAGRIYVADFPLLWDEHVRVHIRKGAALAAPTSLFYARPGAPLMPLAIQLKPAHITEGNPAFTPDRPGWLLARGHVQAADSHYHEAVYHLLETHLVVEVFALATQRQLHANHPLHQLLDTHFENTLAINEQARKNLLAPHGEISKCMAAKHSGAIELARIFWSTWNFQERTLSADLAARDVNDLEGYHYREDALRVHVAMVEYVEGILSLWYETDADVCEDVELQAWARELGGTEGDGSGLEGRGSASVPGFPSRLETRAQLFEHVTEIMFRSSAQHAAVNNGQFGSYGWIPNAPVAVYGELPDQLKGDEKDFYKALPNRARTFGQSGMVWLLSEPTERSLLRTGESPAFAAESSPQAYEVVAQFRRRLRALSDAIEGRNEVLEATGRLPYNYLKPQNIDRSIAI